VFAVAQVQTTYKVVLLRRDLSMLYLDEQLQHRKEG